MNQPLERFQNLLRELFQFDSADLDFGIYRILNERRGLFEDWIENRLPAAVRDALATGAVEQADTQARRLAELAAEIRDDQGDKAIDGDGRLRDDIPGKRATEYRELWQVLQASAQPASADAREAEIYNRLYDFFRRYYEDGDFLSLRRYGADDAYAVPYNGQEVMLHWANRDQYYVKTGEHFTDYRFRAGDKADAWHVEFRLRQAETDRDNTKSADKRHFFFDHGAIEVDAEARTFVVPVAWRAATEAETGNLPARNQQAAINEEAERKLLGKKAVKDQPALLAALKANVAEEEGDPQTLLARHLRRYTRRNTSDFFIHKDLRGFLTRELDYWLKAEVLRLDTLLAGGEQPARAWLQTLGCLREVGTTIIEFVARIEDFQKRLYEKRKFVTECHWCLTLDFAERAGLTERLVEVLNTTDGGKAQKAEWKKLYAIDEVKATDGKPGWKDKVTAEFLRSQPYLVLDTVHMPQDFTDALLASLEDLDDATGGVLVHGDNWQALNLLMERYREQVQCVYIDPPYNTSNDEFVYRDSYQHSSWLSMMTDRLSLARTVMRDSGAFFSSIDDNESARYRLALDAAFGAPSFQSSMAWVKRYAPPPDVKGIGYVHEPVLVYTKSTAFEAGLLPLSDEQVGRYQNPDNDPRGPWKAADYTCRYTASERPSLYYKITNPNTGKKILPKRSRVWANSPETHAKNVKENRIWWGKDGTNSVPALKNFLSDIKQGEAPSSLLHYETVGHTDESAKELRDLLPGIKFTPKPIRLVQHLMRIAKVGDDDVLMDFFGGSGTSAHAVMAFNRSSHVGTSSAKYVLVEFGEHFGDLMCPRIKKIIYSDVWKEGKPVSRQGSSHVFKYLRLESYEDTLSNLRLRADAPGQGGLNLDVLPELYRLGYWLDVETAGSASLLDVENLERPFDYALSVHDGKAARTKPVDLAETFNYLIGLIVRRRQVLDRDGRRYLLYSGRTRADDVVTAVLWRDIAGWGEADFAAERDWIAKQAPFGDAAVIYVNGDSAIPGAQSLDPVFHARMFAPVH